MSSCAGTEHGGTQIEVNSLIITAPVLAQRGRVDDAAQQAAIFLPRAREVGDPQSLGPALVQAAFVSAVRGKLGDAVALVEEFEGFAGGATVEVFGGLTVMARICVAAGEVAIAERLVHGTADVAAGPVALNSMTSSRALLAEAHGELDDAANLYREAAAGWGEWGSVVERAYALVGLGRCGDSDAGREGKAIFERLGAVPFAALAA